MEKMFSAISKTASGQLGKKNAISTERASTLSE
jgi:hypothetical protein